MDNDGEEDLKMMCLFGKKGGPQVGNASRHYRRGTKYLDRDFSLSNYLRDGFFVFKPPELFHTAPLPISMHDIDGESNGGGVISSRRRDDLCNSIENASAPQLHLDQGHLNFLLSGC